MYSRLLRSPSTGDLEVALGVFTKGWRAGCLFSWRAAAGGAAGPRMMTRGMRYSYRGSAGRERSIINCARKDARVRASDSSAQLLRDGLALGSPVGGGA